MNSSLLLIPLLPFLGFLANGLVGRRLPRPAVSALACLGPAISAILSVNVLVEVAAGPSPSITCPLGDWIRAGKDLQVPFTFSADRLSAIMLLVVTGVGTLIHVYATGYMKGDPGYARFFAYLNLFLAAMLVLVLANNIVLLFLGWEGVGLCSYLLIGFWYKDIANCRAGTKAFVINRIGDLGFILGIFLIFVAFGSFELGEINRAAAAREEDPTLFWIGLLLFVGATGKSAQIPLYVWLPDAMAGPTPVSALIHAATMVTSGVYMVSRLGDLFIASGVLPVVAWIGGLTALLAALIALTQTDIKRVLAYSTVSQLGFMFLAAGVGAFGVAMFHVVTHAFFKALLFLGAGAVIHSLHHEQDMRRMGGLLRKIPITATVFLIGALSLSGFPLTAGFFSKDEILHEVFANGEYVLWVLGILTAALTAFYTFRQFCMVFLGSYRGGGQGQDPADRHAGGHAGIHESPPSMLVPLLVLALLSLGGGFLAVPYFLEPTGAAAHGPEGGGDLAGWIIGGTAAVLGIAAALFFYVRAPHLRDRVLATAPAQVFQRWSRDKFYVDEVYERLFVQPFFVLCHVLFTLVDRALIDWLMVGGTSLLVRVLGAGLRRLQTGKVPAYAVYFLAGVIVLLSLMVWAAG